MLDDFKQFIARGNLVDIAVGIAVGTAFATIAKSLVTDVIMPPIGIFLGGDSVRNFFSVIKQGEPAGPYATLADAQAANAVTMNYGVFINNVIAFLIIALVFFVFVRTLNRMKRQEEAAQIDPTDKECPYCRFQIPLAATRCPQCTSQLEGATG